MMCGGTSDVKDATDEIQTMIAEVRQDLEQKAGKSFPQYKAISFKTQIVAGTNYFVKILVDNDDYIHVRIFKSLPHAGSSLAVHSHESGKTKDDNIEYF